MCNDMFVPHSFTSLSSKHLGRRLRGNIQELWSCFHSFFIIIINVVITNRNRSSTITVIAEMHRKEDQVNALHVLGENLLLACMHIR